MINWENKIRQGLVFTLLFVGIAGRAEALIPLPTYDIKRVAQTVQNTALQISEIKMEVESNLNIVREISNGGFGTAALDLFGKIQGGAYDRFGHNLTDLKSSLVGNLEEIKEAKLRRNLEEKYRIEGMSKKEAKARAAKERAEIKAKEARAKIEASAEKKESTVEKTYKFLQRGSLGNVINSAGGGNILAVSGVIDMVDDINNTFDNNTGSSATTPTVDLSSTDAQIKAEMDAAREQKYQACLEENKKAIAEGKSPQLCVK